MLNINHDYRNYDSKKKTLTLSSPACLFYAAEILFNDSAKITSETVFV